MRRLLLTLVLVASVAACGDDGDDRDADRSAATTTAAPVTTTTTAVAPTTTVAPATTTTAVEVTTTTTCELPGGSTEARSAAIGAPTTMLLTDVEVAPAGCLDRVTFSFRPSGPDVSPGYRAAYETGPFVEDGSGRPVDVAGSAFVVVRLEPAAGVDLSVETAPQTYTGPRTIDPSGTAHVVQLRQTGDFEGIVTWVIGLDARRPFTVEATAGPPRLVVTFG